MPRINFDEKVWGSKEVGVYGSFDNECHNCGKPTATVVGGTDEKGSYLGCKDCISQDKNRSSAPVGILHCKEGGIAKTHIKDMEQRTIGPDGKCYNKLNGKMKRRVGDYG